MLTVVNLIMRLKMPSMLMILKNMIPVRYAREITLIKM